MRLRNVVAAAALCVPVALGAASAGVPGGSAQDAERQFVEAESAYAGGDARGAVAMLDELIKRFPRARFPAETWRAAANVRAGEIELDGGRAAVASARFLDVIDGEPATPWTSRARVGLATTLLWAKEWPAAAALLQQVVDAVHTNDATADIAAAATAADRLTLLDRVWLRVAAGQLPWQRSGQFALGASVRRPIGIAASRNGVLVTDEDTDAVVFRDSGGNAASFSVPDVERPWWSPRGDPYVAARSAISEPLGVGSFRFAYSDGSRQRDVEDIRAGASTAAGAWVVLDARSDQVLRFDGAGAFQGALDVRGGEPVDVEIGPRGRVFVLEDSRSEVMVFGPDGTPSGAFSLETWRQPYALAIDAIGYVYVLDRGNKRIDVFDADAGVVWTIGPLLPGGGEFDDPRDLTVDARGRILVADRGFAAVLVIE